MTMSGLNSEYMTISCLNGECTVCLTRLYMTMSGLNNEYMIISDVNDEYMVMFD
jgi:hypothetical protein